MKSLPILILVLSVVATQAESTNAAAARIVSTNAAPVLAGSTNVAPERVAAQLATEQSKPIVPTGPVRALDAKPNEIFIGNVTLDGITVEAVKTGRPLKLINPFSPPVNSSPEDNVNRDVFNGKVTGLNFFAVHFR